MEWIINWPQAIAVIGVAACISGVLIMLIYKMP